MEAQQQQQQQQRLRGWLSVCDPTHRKCAMDGAPGRFRSGEGKEGNRQRLVPGAGNRRYFLSKGRTRGRMFFATILLPSAVAWVLSACIMPSTPYTPLRRNGNRGASYFFASRT